MSGRRRRGGHVETRREIRLREQAAAKGAAAAPHGARDTASQSAPTTATQGTPTNTPASGQERPLELPGAQGLLPDPATPGPERAGATVDQNLRSPSLVMLVVAAAIGVIAYAVFLTNPANAGDPLLYIAVLICEGFLITQALLTMWTALSAPFDPREYTYHEAGRQLFFYTPDEIGHEDGAGTQVRPDWMQIAGRRLSVDVFVTTYGEDLGIIERTLVAARDMRGHHRTIVLDDGHSDEVRALAERLGVDYISREGNEGAKAGNVNHALGLTNGEFFVILDADFVAKPNFLVETVPFFAEEKVAFVQTPQVYGNIHNFISRGAGFMQATFYSLAMPGKNRFNSAFCVGTNVIFRRRAIEQIGGMYSKSKSEDIWTAMTLHERGWKSVYIPTVLAVGDTPETIEAYTKQQLRWATGAFEIFFTRNPLFNRRLTADQRLQYFGTSMFYFSGLMLFFLLLMPSLQILLNLTPVNQNVGLANWLMVYLGFYGMQILMATVFMGSFRWEVLLLATASFSIYMRSLGNVLRGREVPWSVTGRVGAANSPFNYILPQAWMFLYLTLTTVIGVLKWSWTAEFSIALVWNVINMTAFGIFIVLAFQESRRLRRGEEASRPIAAQPAPVAA